MKNKLWRNRNNIPKDGKWIYVIRMVSCLDCGANEKFVFGYYEDKKWRDHETGEPLEKKYGLIVESYLNVELFWYHGENYDIED